MLLTRRHDVITTYMQPAAGPELLARLAGLPSHLCATIADGGRLCEPAHDFTGLPGSSLLMFEHCDAAVPPLVVPDRLAQGTLTRVGLAGFEVAPVLGRRRALLQEALELARRAPAEVSAVLAASLGMVCWLRPAHGSTNQLSSTSFYEFPHCAFVTDLVTRHVSPNVLFPKPSAYALLDNLYHEALHQQLIATMRGVTLLDAAAGNFTVEVEWRQERWQVEHALHALLVYRRLTEFRRTMALRAEPALSQVLERAGSDASDCALRLKRGLLDIKTAFTPPGLAFCASL